MFTDTKTVSIDGELTLVLPSMKDISFFVPNIVKIEDKCNLPSPVTSVLKADEIKEELKVRYEYKCPPVLEPPSNKRRKLNINAQRKYEGYHSLEVLIAAAVLVEIGKNDDILMDDIGNQWQKFIKPEMLYSLLQSSEHINNMANTRQIL